ncbi:hypothetical protein BSKO_04975 [Bryopsis sp. KO-2023]|nr:hypothetical protein BSKO_04975 [Bryopsis sp. KO-2023]
MALEKRAPELIRIYVSEDHRVKAQFSDNSLIVLDSGGGSFVHCCPQGSRVRQLTHFAVSRFQENIASALNFRNMHLAEPFYCQWLTKNHSREPVFTTGYTIRSVRWPKSFQEGMREGSIEWLDGGGVMVRSEDGWAQVVMHPSRQRFVVCYPLLLSAPKKEQFQYIWHTQVFSVSHYPSRWTCVVALVLEAVVESDLVSESAERQSQQDCVNSDGSNDESGKTPKSRDEEGLSPDGGSLTRTSQLPVNAEPHPSACHTSDIPDDSWWFEPTVTVLPKTDAIVVEWSPEATYQYIIDKREVEAWVHSDESCVFTCKGGRYFRHLRQPYAEDRMHACSSISQMLRSSEGGTAMAIGKIAKRALKLRQGVKFMFPFNPFFVLVLRVVVGRLATWKE